MTDPTGRGAPPPRRETEPGEPLPAGRAALVLLVFVVATILLVTQLHTSSAPTSSAASSGTTTTSTTRPHSTAPTTTTTTVPPSQVPVLVANGSGVTGAAATVADELHAAGWDTLTPVNATATVPATTVYYAPGAQPSAAAVAGGLHLPAAQVQPLTATAPVSPGTAQVVVVIGPDLAHGTSTATTGS